MTYQSWYGVDADTVENDPTFNPAGIYTDKDGNIRFHDNQVDDYQQDHYQLHWNQKFDNSWSSNLSLNYTYGRGFFEEYKEDEDFANYDFTPIELGGETINTTDLIRRRWLDNDFYVASASVNYKDNNIDVISGALFSTYRGDHFGEVIWAQNAGGSNINDRYYDGDAEKNEVSAFAKATYRFNKQWSVYGDLQGRFIDYTTGGINSDRQAFEIDENYSFFNPKAGVTYSFNSANQFYASFARANREPNRTDFENGSPKPERLNDYELGWRYSNPTVNLNINGYYMGYRDQLVLTGAIDDVGAPIRANSGKSYRAGIEIDAAVKISKHLSIQPNIALSSNKNQDFFFQRDGVLTNLGSTNISFSPDIVIGNTIRYAPIDGFQVSFLSKYVGEQYMGNIDSKASLLEAFFINDLSISYELKELPIFKSIVFNGLVNNIFNKNYVSNGYFFTFDDDYSSPGDITTIEGAGYYPQSGINFLVGATLKF